jgi:three-Cys-motif partner protein
MTWDDEFFSGQRRLTSKLKHLVLRPYVKEFAYHLGSVRPVVYYVDGFAGAGVYTAGTHREDGSPLMIARLAEELRGATPRPIQLHCINVEADKERFESLEAETAVFTPDIVEQNYHSTFIEALPDILRRIGDAAAFFFIDPFGTKDIPFEELLPIFQRKATTEVLITDGRNCHESRLVREGEFAQSG